MKTGQKNVRQKNQKESCQFFIFLSHIFLSGLLIFLSHIFLSGLLAFAISLSGDSRPSTFSYSTVNSRSEEFRTPRIINSSVLVNPSRSS